jgi:hypothetical protein
VGLFSRGIKDGVAAQAEVVRMAPTGKGARQEGKRNVDYEFLLRVTLPGRAAYEVEHVEQVPWDRMPHMGQTLAVTVSASDPDRLKIDWDNAPNVVDAAQASAEAALRGDAAGAAEAFGFEPRDEPPAGAT